MTDEEKSIYQSQIYQRNFQKSLKTQIDGFLKDLNSKQYATMTEYMEDCYKNGYLGAMYSIHKQGIPIISPIDQKKVTKAMQLDPKISKNLYTKLGEDVTLLKKRIANNVSRGIATSDSYANIARNVASTSNVGFNRAMRIARTEGHRVQVEAASDAQYAAKEAGADIVKQWSAALDGRTRESHARVDGEIRELDEKFSNGLKYPGDSAGGAAEVVNCRCALLQRARWALDDEFTKMNNFTKEIESFDSPKTYAEFKKGFFSDDNVKYMNYVQQMEKKYATKDFRKVLDSMTNREYNYYSELLGENPVFDRTVLISGGKRNIMSSDKDAQPAVKKTVFVPAKSIDEAEEYIKKFVDSSGFGATGISYKGISVESANAVNEALEKLYDRFNMDKLGGVYVAKGNTKLGKTIDGATAAYSPIRKSLLINNQALKNPDVFLKSRKEELEIINKYKENPASYTFKTKSAEDVAKASLVSGRATVPDTVEDVINHEMGHSIEKMVAKADGYETVKANMSKYAEKISGYATINEAEYIAESFASYLKDEGLIDPNLEKIFKSLERNG